MVMLLRPLLISVMDSTNHQMPRERNQDSGKYTQAYTDEEFIEAVSDSNEAATTTEVSDVLGCSNRTALLRLRDLADAGELKRRKAGTVNLWSVADAETET